MKRDIAMEPTVIRAESQVFLQSCQSEGFSYIQWTEAAEREAIATAVRSLERILSEVKAAKPKRTL
jgi:hypothetical protein